MTKEDWLKKAAAQFIKNGMFEKNDGLISDAYASELAQNALLENPDAINKDAEEYVKHNVTELFADGEDDEKD